MKLRYLSTALFALALAPASAGASPYPRAAELEASARGAIRVVAVDASILWGAIFGTAVAVGGAAELLKRLSRRREAGAPERQAAPSRHAESDEPRAIANASARS